MAKNKRHHFFAMLSRLKYIQRWALPIWEETAKFCRERQICHGAKPWSNIAVMIPIAHLKTEEPPCDKIPSIWYFEPDNGMGFQPTDYVDITDFYQTKMAMLNCMESQKAWMADNYASLRDDQERFLDTIRIMSEFRGMQAGCKYAEGFVRAMDGFRTRMTERVLP